MPLFTKDSGHSFANVVSGWSVQTDQSTTGASTYVAGSSNFRASDLQIAKLDGNFTMAHRMGLIGMSLSAHNVYDNITYDGNTYNNETKKWEVSSYGTYNVWNGSTTFTSTDVPLVNGSKCYQVVKPNVTTPSYTTSTVTASKKYAWSQSCTAVSEANKYDSYTIDYDVDFIAATWVFSCSGQGRQWVAPKAGIYKIECWGAQGGKDIDTEGACGGYVKGNINLNKQTELFVYVGRKGKTYTEVSSQTSGINYGGVSTGAAQGGGSTDIRISGGEWNNSTSLRSRIIVAAGGGGAENNGKPGGAAGGLHGYDSPAGIKGATQNSGFGFGVAEYTWADMYSSGGETHRWGGGGNGYYSGISASSPAGGGGGSSFISGHPGCTSVSGYVFTEGSTEMIDGQGKLWTTSNQTTGGSSKTMPTTNGGQESLNTGHSGDGYAKITSQ